MARKPKTVKQVAQTATKPGLTKKLGEFLNDAAKAASKVVKAKGESKANKLRAKAEVIKQRQGIRKTQAIAAGFASAANSVAEANKSVKESTQSTINEALAKYNAIISNSATPAEGTGSASSGSSSGVRVTPGA